MQQNELVQKEFVKERGEEKRQGEESPLTNFFLSFKLHVTFSDINNLYYNILSEKKMLVIWARLGIHIFIT